MEKWKDGKMEEWKMEEWKNGKVYNVTMEKRNDGKTERWKRLQLLVMDRLVDWHSQGQRIEALLLFKDRQRMH